MIKVSSITFIKEGSIPEPTRNGPNAEMFNQLIAELQKMGKGQGLQFKVEKFKKHQRYAIQKGLQKRGFKVQVIEIGKDTLAVRRVED